MTVGNNGGHQLNLLIFEVGILSRIPLPDGTYIEVPATIGIHPLVVAPSTIKYADNSRSTLDDNQDGNVVNVAGRKPRVVQLSGTFGQASRGLGPYLGTGELRFQRFYHDVVRLHDCTSQEQVDAEKDILRSPLREIALKLAGYTEEYATFYVNFYDFWNDLKFQCRIPSFSWARGAKGGGAVGLVSYDFTVVECGDVVTGTLLNSLLNGMFEVLTTWTKINTLLTSYTLDAITTSFVDLGGIVVSQLAATVDALAAQARGVQALLNGGGARDSLGNMKLALSNSVNGFGDAVTGGNSSSSSSASGTPATAAKSTSPAPWSRTAPQVPATSAARVAGSRDQGLGGFFSLADLAKSQALDVVQTLTSALASNADPNAGVFPAAWPPMVEIPALDIADQIASTYKVISTAEFQSVVGCMYGMSRAEFREYVASSGTSGLGGSLLRSRTHVVAAWDTLETLAAKGNVDVETLVRFNGDRSPTELLLPGTVIEIPERRPSNTRAKIDGLPVFGSHIGRASLGSDLTIDLECVEGDFMILTETDALQQGVDWLIEATGPDLLKLIADFPQEIPGIQEKALETQYKRILTTDARIQSVDSVVVERSIDDTGFHVAVQAQAIGGVSFSTGG